MAYLVGQRLTEVFTASSSPNGFGLGDVVTDHDGKEYVFLQASATITGKGYACFVTTANLATMVSTSNDARGNLVAVAPAAMSAGERGWFQRKGFCEVYAAASCAANARVNTTATAGVLDDDGTTGAMAIDGLVLTTANGGAAALAPAVLSYPTIGVTL